MNNKEKLLHDVLSEGADPFRQQLLQASLAELRLRKKSAKPSFFLWAIAAGFALGAGLIFSTLSHRTREVPQATLRKPSYPPIEIVTTTTPLKMALIDNHKYPTLIVDNSSFRHPIELLGDAELLALFPDKPAGLLPGS